MQFAGILVVLYVSGTSNVGNLFHMAGQVGKAVGTLVTVMTDEEGSGSDDELDLRKTGR